jgi:methionyl-tRNA synthetase
MNTAPNREALLAAIRRPRRAVVTAGMPYATGPIHIGHLAGAHIPADIYARYLRMLIGAERVLFVCGSDDHGSTSELSALQAQKPIPEFLGQMYDQHKNTFHSYGISFDAYSGTSRPECFSHHKELAQDMLCKLHGRGLLQKRVTEQWYDLELKRFLQDRFVKGTCPNPKCRFEAAYSEQCERCDTTYEPRELLDPVSALSGSRPELRPTAHWWLDMWTHSESLREWIQSKEKLWRKTVYSAVISQVLPTLQFPNSFEESFKPLRAELPKHSSKYAAGKMIQVQFQNKKDFELGQKLLEAHGVASRPVNDWAFRSITRDVAWGIPVPEDLDPDLVGKTLYVWPDSLIAPISFTKVALQLKGQDSARYEEFWKDPESKVYQFLGQDNVYFYCLMQGAMWLGSQKNPGAQPEKGDLQLTENIFGSYHLMVDGEKMSKSRGNFYTGDQMLLEKNYHPDQIRYFLALLSLPEKASNFDFSTFEERNRFLAGPMNAAFEKPLSAAHSKFGGVVPAGKWIPKVEEESLKMIQKYLRSMERGEYSTLLFAIENYARQINSLFTQYKPHDDRHDETQRKDALFTCFAVLKNIMIMLYPFAPQIMEKLRQSLRLPESVFSIDELGLPIPGGHAVGEKQEFFPAVDAAPIGN